MNINATLFGQMITFALFVWFTVKFVFPPILKAMAERQKTIADGLVAAERGVRELEAAHHKASSLLHDARIQAGEVIKLADARASKIMEESQEAARKEGERLIVLAKVEIEREVQSARKQLQGYLAEIATQSAEKIIEQKMDDAANNDLLKKMIADIKTL